MSGHSSVSLFSERYATRFLRKEIIKQKTYLHWQGSEITAFAFLISFKVAKTLICFAFFGTTRL